MKDFSDLKGASMAEADHTTDAANRLEPTPSYRRNRLRFIGLGVLLCVVVGVVIGLASHSQSRAMEKSILRTLNHADGMFITAVISSVLSPNGQDQVIHMYARNLGQDSSSIDLDLFATTTQADGVRYNYTIMHGRGMFTMEMTTTNETSTSPELLYTGCLMSEQIPPLRQLADQVLETERREQTDEPLWYGRSCADGSINIVQWAGREFMYCAPSNGELKQIYSPFLSVNIDYWGADQMTGVEERLAYANATHLETCEVLDFDRELDNDDDDDDDDDVITESRRLSVVNSHHLNDPALSMFDSSLFGCVGGVPCLSMTLPPFNHKPGYSTMVGSKTDVYSHVNPHFGTSYGRRRLTQQISPTEFYLEPRVTGLTQRRSCVFVALFPNGFKPWDKDFVESGNMPTYCDTVSFVYENADHHWDVSMVESLCNNIQSFEKPQFRNNGQAIDEVIVIAHGVANYAIGYGIIKGKCSFSSQTKWVALNVVIETSNLMNKLSDLQCHYVKHMLHIYGLFNRRNRLGGAQALVHVMKNCQAGSTMKNQLGIFRGMLRNSNLPADARTIEVKHAIKNRVNTVICGTNPYGTVSQDHDVYTFLFHITHTSGNAHDGLVEVRNCKAKPGDFFHRDVERITYNGGHFDYRFTSDSLFGNSNAKIMTKLQNLVLYSRDPVLQDDTVCKSNAGLLLRGQSQVCGNCNHVSSNTRLCHADMTQHTCESKGYTWCQKYQPTLTCHSDDAPCHDGKKCRSASTLMMHGHKKICLNSKCMRDGACFNCECPSSMPCKDTITKECREANLHGECPINTIMCPVPIYGQCGGPGWRGSKNCGDNRECKGNASYKSCQWKDNLQCIAPGGQCGYGVNNCCGSDFKCKFLHTGRNECVVKD